MNTLRTRSARTPGLLLTAMALALLGLPGLLGCGGAEPSAPQVPYNLVIVLSDALRASNLELYGYPRKTAPRLASLAPESVVFDRHLAAFPGTPVSVSQIMTGRLMPPLLMDFTYGEAPVRGLTDDLLILPREFQRRGYTTGIVSSHVWFNDRARVLAFFDRQAIVPPDEGQPYAPIARLTEPVERFLDEARQPFFLYVHSMDTHGPFHVHPGFDSYRSQPGWPKVYGAYDSEIAYTDHWVGRLVDSLRRRGLLESTVFVFTSDHGEELGEMGPEYWNRSHGNTIRWAQLHVPLLVRLPGARRGGARIAAATNHLDLAETLLHLADPGRELSGYRLDGRDLSDLVTSGTRPEPRTLVAYTWRYWGLFRDGRELHYDQWRNRFDLYETKTVRFNYPMSVPLDDPDLARRLGRELETVSTARTRERIRGPLPAAGLDDAVIGLPTTVVGHAAPPTYDRDLEDGKWWLDTTRLLEAGPDEHPEPLKLATPWVPGRYRVRVRLDPGRVAEGWEDRFRLRVGDAPEELELSGAEADEESLLDAGVHEIGRVLTIEIAEPRGGVAITGLRLTRVGSDASSGAADKALEERLRALGYVQ